LGFVFLIPIEGKQKINIFRMIVFCNMLKWLFEVLYILAGLSFILVQDKNRIQSFKCIVWQTFKQLLHYLLNSKWKS